MIEIKTVVLLLVGTLLFAAFCGYLAGREGVIVANEKQNAIKGYWATRRSAENRALHELLIRYNVPKDTINDCIGDFE